MGKLSVEGRGSGSFNDVVAQRAVLDSMVLYRINLKRGLLGIVSPVDWCKQLTAL